MDKPIRIDNWRTVSNPYAAPEVRDLRVSGVVKPGADPRRPEGSGITTSRVVSVDGRTFRTSSGTFYVLGTIDPEFRKWLRKERPNWNPRQPITMIGG